MAVVCDVYCIFVTFTCGILGQVWYFIVSFPDRCRLSKFDNMTKIAVMPINGKQQFKNLLLQNQKADDLRTW